MTILLYIKMWKITVACGIGLLKTSLRCKERLFEDIPCGLEPLKTTLRCKERPLEYIEISIFLPLRGRPAGAMAGPPDPPSAFTRISLFRIQGTPQKTISLIMHNSLIIHDVILFIQCNFFHFFFQNHF